MMETRAKTGADFLSPLQKQVGQLGQLGHSPETRMVKGNNLPRLCLCHWDANGTGGTLRIQDVSRRRAASIASARSGKGKSQ